MTLISNLKYCKGLICEKNITCENLKLKRSLHTDVLRIRLLQISPHEIFVITIKLKFVIVY